MSDLLPTKVGETEVYIEVSPSYGAEDVSAVDSVVGRAEDAFERARQTIVQVAESLTSAVRHMDAALTPDEFTLEFAIKFGGEGQVILTKLTGEAQITVSLTHRHRRE